MIDPAHEPVLDLRGIFGVEARITVPSEATGGAYVEMDCTAAPGSETILLVLARAPSATYAFRYVA